MSLLYLLSYVGILAAAGFVVLSLASGLLWISEFIEEHSRIAKTTGIRAIYAIITIHILLYFTDGLPFTHLLFSIICHTVYLQNFSHTWPYISLVSPAFIASCVLAIANHFMWFFYFSHRHRDARLRAQRGYRGGMKSPSTVTVPGFANTATFFGLCVWLIPLFLFLSLSANDNALPIISDSVTSPTALSSLQSITTSRSSLFKSILDLFPFLRRRQTREGILVTHTPTPSAPSTPRTSFSGQSPYYTSASPRASLDTGFPASPALRPPPKRSMTGSPSPASPSLSSKRSEEGVGVKGVGLGIGRNSSFLASRSMTDDSPVRRRGVVE